jgi:hypothetical protein
LTRVELAFNLAEGRQSCGELTFGLYPAVASLQAAGIAPAVRVVTLGSEQQHVAVPHVVKQLAELPSLYVLNLARSITFSDAGLSALSCLTGLSTLNLWQFQRRSKHQILEQLPEVFSQLPSLHTLVVPSTCRKMSWLSDADLQLLTAAERQALKDRLTALPGLACIGYV